MPVQRFVYAPPLAESFDKVIDRSHLTSPQPPLKIGYFSPKEIEFCECGTLSHPVQIDDRGQFTFPDEIKPFGAVLQLALDYFFTMAVHPEGIKCRMLVTDFYNVVRGEYARPKYPDEFLHIDQSHRDVFEDVGHPAYVTDRWYTIFTWSSALPTEFGHHEIAYESNDTPQKALTKILTHSVRKPVTFSPGDLVCHTGATPHRIARNVFQDVIPRQFLAMVLYR